MFLRHSPRAQSLAIGDKVSFLLRIVPLIIHMNHFSCLLTIVQINIFEEPQNIFFSTKIPDPKLSSQSPVYLTIECPPPGSSSQN